MFMKQIERQYSARFMRHLLTNSESEKEANIRFVFININDHYQCHYRSFICGKRNFDFVCWLQHFISTVLYNLILIVILK